MYQESSAESFKFIQEVYQELKMDAVGPISASILYVCDADSHKSAGKVFAESERMFYFERT